MKRSPMPARKAPMARAAMKRRPSAAKLTPFERSWLRWVVTLECRARLLPGHVCRGRMTAHHAGRRPGTGMKAPHVTAIPLCWRAHLEGIEVLRDVFTGWTKERVRAWEDEQIAAVQLLAVPESYDQAIELQEAGLGAVGFDATGWFWAPGGEAQARGAA